MTKVARLSAVAVAAALVIASISIWAGFSRRQANLEHEIALLKAEGGCTHAVDLLPAPLGNKAGESVALLFPLQFKWPYPNAAVGGKPVDFRDAKVADAVKIRKAFDEYTTWLASWPSIASVASNPSGRAAPRWNDDWRPWLGKLAADNGAFLDSVRSTVDGEPPMFDIDWSHGSETLLPHLSPLRSTARLLSADAVVRCRNGDTAGALEDVGAILRLRLFIDKEPAAISHLVSYAIDSAALRTIAVILEKGRPDRAAVEKMLAYLDGREELNRLTTALLGETAMGLDMFELVSRNPDILASSGLSSYLGYPQQGEPLSTKMERLVFRTRFKLTWSRTSDEISFLKTMREIRARSRKDYPTMLEGLPDPSPASTAVASASGPPKALAPLLVGSLPSLFRSQAIADTHLRMTRAALALYLYRMDVGAYPATLDTLIPKYLKVPQLDPYDGRPLRYRPTGRGFTLYSVGPDSSDDSGASPSDIVWQHEE